MYLNKPKTQKKSQGLSDVNSFYTTPNQFVLCVPKEWSEIQAIQWTQSKVIRSWVITELKKGCACRRDDPECHNKYKHYIFEPTR